MQVFRVPYRVAAPRALIGPATSLNWQWRRPLRYLARNPAQPWQRWSEYSLRFPSCDRFAASVTEPEAALAIYEATDSLPLYGELRAQSDGRSLITADCGWPLRGGKRRYSSGWLEPYDGGHHAGARCGCRPPEIEACRWIDQSTVRLCHHGLRSCQGVLPDLSWFCHNATLVIWGSCCGSAPEPTRSI